MAKCMEWTQVSVCPYTPLCFVNHMYAAFTFTCLQLGVLMGMQEVMPQSWLHGGTRVRGGQAPGTSLTPRQGGAMFALEIKIKVMRRQKEMRVRLSKSGAAERVLERWMREGKRGF